MSYQVFRDNIWITENPVQGDVWRFFDEGGGVISGNCWIPKPVPSLEELETSWRDAELKRTDSIVMRPDCPYMEEVVQYRTSLRNWTDTDTFPHTRPVEPLTTKGYQIK